MTGFNDAQASSFPVDSDPLIITLDSDEHSLSRSNSVPNLQEGTSVAANGRTRSGQKDKGKRRETETAVVCVKEEPNTISLHSPEPPPINLATIPPHISGNRILTSSAGQLNEDHCSACHSQGALVYCDGCPRAFHFWCLDPPMEATDLPEGDSWWFCPSCTIRKVRMKTITPLFVRFIDSPSSRIHLLSHHHPSYHRLFTTHRPIFPQNINFQKTSGRSSKMVSILLHCHA